MFIVSSLNRFLSLSACYEVGTCLSPATECDQRVLSALGSCCPAWTFASQTRDSSGSLHSLWAGCCPLLEAHMPHFMAVCPEQSSVAALLPCLPPPRSVTALRLPVHGCAPAASSQVFVMQWRSTPQNGNIGLGMPV